VVSCPTCGRCDIDLIQLAGQVEQLVSGLTEPLTIAVMGCEVNGPGEAREADLGIAGGKKNGLIFCKGEILCKVPQDRLLEDFKKYLFHYLGNKENRGSPSENHCDRPRV
jgi:(E)-4-hydroxy-3-methylbut-2-enyl-diphosphate synthase